MYNEETRIKLFNHIYDFNNLLELLNITQSKLYYLLYAKNTYKEFSIPKKRGGFRVIDAPCFELKRIQKDLNYIISKNISLNKKVIHGFIEDNSIKTNAHIHKNSKFILNIDLKDFFDTIHFGRVRGMFMNTPFNFSSHIATILAKLTCHNKKLPQGAPTSPLISNIICRSLDSKLSQLCRKYNCKYTRYADDLTISCNSNFFPSEIAVFESKSVSLSNKIKNIIENEGFQINYDKISFADRSCRQEVTGLIVNQKVNIKKIYIKTLRAQLNNIKKNGILEEAKKFFHNPSKKNNINIIKQYQNVIYGKINFLKNILGKESKIFIKYATEFNSIVGKEYFDVDFGKSIEEYISARVFPICSYCKSYFGSSFIVENEGLYTATHTIIGRHAFFSEDDFQKTKKLEKFHFLDFHPTPFYLISKNKRILFNPMITQSNITSDILIDKTFKSKKEFKINRQYKLQQNEDIYVYGYTNSGEKEPFNPLFFETKAVSISKFCGIKYILVLHNIFSGMSGGPVLNKNREIIGIIHVGSNNNEYISEINGFIPFCDISNFEKTSIND